MTVWLLLLSLCLDPARAVEVEATTVPCPIGDHPTRVFRLVAQNTHGGWDSDGARYSTRGQFRTYELATCPDNLLTLTGDDMTRVMTAAQVETLGPVLESIAAGVDDPKTLATWDRYAIAARIYRALDADHLFLARLYVKGGWTARDHGVGVYEGLDGPAAARAVLIAGPVELEKELTGEQERTILLNLARVAHRGGYAAERDGWLATLEARDDLTEEDRDGVERLKIAAAVEPLFQDPAIIELDAFLGSTEGTALQRVEATFLLGDLLRRRGRTAEAQAAYGKVIADPEAPEQLVELATWLSDELAGKEPWKQAAALTAP